MSEGARVLVTGFSAFPGVPDNPTETLVRALAAEAWTPAGVARLQAMVLPTEYAAGGSLLDATLAALVPTVVVGFGVHATAHEFRIECVARNRIDSVRPDAAGVRPTNRRIRDGGAPTHAPTFDPVDLYEAVRNAGAPVRLSHDAGGYLCNFAFYRIASWARASGHAPRVGFVHVPPVTGDAAHATLLRAAKAAITAAAG